LSDTFSNIGGLIARRKKPSRLRGVSFQFLKKGRNLRVREGFQGEEPLDHWGNQGRGRGA